MLGYVKNGPLIRLLGILVLGHGHEVKAGIELIHQFFVFLHIQEKLQFLTIPRDLLQKLRVLSSLLNVEEILQHASVGLLFFVFGFDFVDVLLDVLHSPLHDGREGFLVSS